MNKLNSIIYNAVNVRVRAISDGRCRKGLMDFDKIDMVEFARRNKLGFGPKMSFDRNWANMVGEE